MGRYLGPGFVLRIQKHNIKSQRCQGFVEIWCPRHPPKLTSPLVVNAESRWLIARGDTSSISADLMSSLTAPHFCDRQRASEPAIVVGRARTFLALYRGASTKKIKRHKAWLSTQYNTGKNRCCSVMRSRLTCGQSMVVDTFSGTIFIRGCHLLLVTHRKWTLDLCFAATVLQQKTCIILLLSAASLA